MSKFYSLHRLIVGDRKGEGGKEIRVGYKSMDIGNRKLGR